MYLGVVSKYLWTDVSPRNDKLTNNGTVPVLGTPRLKQPGTTSTPRLKQPGTTSTPRIIGEMSH